jgi:PAS domain S-box-containing protein
MKTLLAHLTRSYPYFYGDRKINALMFLCASGFVLHTMLFVRPDMIVSRIETNYVQAAIAYACITFITAMSWAEIVRLLFLPWLADWRLYKELILTLSCILMMGVLNYLYIYLAGQAEFRVNYFNLADITSVVALTFVSGLFPLITISLVRIVLLERSQKKSMPVVADNTQLSDVPLEELHVNEANETFGLKLQEVSIIESMGNYVKIYQVQNQVAKVTIKRITMKRMEELLASQQSLIRIHRLYFANIAHVHRLKKDEDGNLSLIFQNPEKMIPVSRNKRKEVGSLVKVAGDAEHDKLEGALKNLRVRSRNGKHTGGVTDMQRVLPDEIDKFKLISENISDLVCLHEPRDARYLYVSPACKDLTGFTPEEMEGKSPYDFFHPDMIKALQEDHRKKEAGEIPDIPTGPPPKIVYLCRTKEQGFRWMESHSRPIFDKEGHVIMILSTTRDVHEREVAEKEKQRLLHLLESQHQLITN